MTDKKEFSKTIECPHCGQLVTIKFTYDISIDKFDIYRVVGV